MPLQACFYGQVACLCQFWSNSSRLDTPGKPKRDFVVKFGQNWLLTSTRRGQFLWKFKNYITGLFLWPSWLFVPILVQFKQAEHARQAKTWFWGQIWPKFDLWPLPYEVNLAKFEKRLYRLLFRVKFLVCANFGPDRTCWTWTIRQKLIFWSNLVKKLTFDLYVWGQFLWNFKNAFKVLFLELSCLFLPILVQFRLTNYEL